MALVMAVKPALQNHLYLFDNKVYMQLMGVPIGDNHTNIAAKLVMYRFVKGYRKKLARQQLEEQVYLLKLYVVTFNNIIQY